MPTGTNPWNYNELPQHLKDYMAKNPYIYTINNQNYYGADAFNMTDRRGQDFLINQWDTRHAANARAEEIRNRKKAEAPPAPVSSGNTSTSPSQVKNNRGYVGQASSNNPKQITYASDRMADAIRRGVSSGKMDRSQLNNVHNRDTGANLGALLPNGTNNSALLEAMSYGVPLEMRKSIEAQAQQKGLYGQYMNRPVAYGNTSNASKPSQLINQLTPTRKSPVPMPQKKPSALPSKQQATNRTPVKNNRVGVFGSPDQKQMIV